MTPTVSEEHLNYSDETMNEPIMELLAPPNYELNLSPLNDGRTNDA